MKHFILLITVSGMTASVAQAQWTRNVGVVVDGNNSGAGSTLRGDEARGLAQVVRAAGAKNVADSESRIRNEEARGKYIENYSAWTKAYMERQDAIDERREEDRERIRKRREFAKTKKKHLPRRLSSNELNRSTGEINWPTALRNPKYKNERSEIDKLVRTIANGGLTQDIAMQLFQSARKMKNVVGRDARELGFNAYTGASRFLDSVGYEGRYALGEG